MVRQFYRAMAGLQVAEKYILTLPIPRSENWHSPCKTPKWDS